MSAASDQPDLMARLAASLDAAKAKHRYTAPTLRDVMYAREGRDETERQIRRGLRAWAVERRSPCLHRTGAIAVFGTGPADAKRRAAAPARLGEGVEGDTVEVAEIVSGWDEPLDWPLGA